MRRPVLKRIVLAAVASGVGVANATVPADARGAAAVSAAAPATSRGTSLTAMAASSADSGASGVAPAPEIAPATSDHTPPVSEPSGYWTGPTNSPVPTTLSGAKVISSTHATACTPCWITKHPVLVDVSSAPRRPDNMAPGAPWLPLPHHAIPGTLWIPGPGAGEIPAPVESFFRQQLAKATDNDPTRPVVIYCHKSCWLSWNAAKRALSYGYQHVYWYRDGIEGWKAAGLPTAVV